VVTACEPDRAHAREAVPTRRTNDP
jgi:hypothetical protein